MGTSASGLWTPRAASRAGNCPGLNRVSCSIHQIPADPAWVTTGHFPSPLWSYAWVRTIALRETLGKDRNHHSGWCRSGRVHPPVCHAVPYYGLWGAGLHTLGFPVDTEQLVVSPDSQALKSLLSSHMVDVHSTHMHKPTRTHYDPGTFTVKFARDGL